MITEKWIKLLTGANAVVYSGTVVCAGSGAVIALREKTDKGRMKKGQNGRTSGGSWRGR